MLFLVIPLNQADGEDEPVDTSAREGEGLVGYLREECSASGGAGGDSEGAGAAGAPAVAGVLGSAGSQKAGGGRRRVHWGPWGHSRQG